MMKTIFLVMMLVDLAGAFAPMTVSFRTTSLQAFEGKTFDASRNPYARGGKNSWEFEQDTMYVEEPKTKPTVAKRAPAKKVVAKKAPIKKVTAKKAPAKKVVAKKVVAKKAAPKSVFGKKAATKKIAAKEAPKNPFLSLFQK